MYLQLDGLHSLSLKFFSTDEPLVQKGYEVFDVLYCGVCRTDAKIWDEGHRDLILPRILGHEFVVADREGRRYTVWPALCCGSCERCRTGRENLCESIEILGFHRDGGYANRIALSRKNIFAVDGVKDHIICFAEPVACSIGALDKLEVEKGQRVVILGGGTQGLITALLVKDIGAVPLIIERNHRKIEKARRLCRELGIKICEKTDEADFDGAINVCQSTVAFSLCLTKLKKGGKLCFFSGLPKHGRIENNLANLIHYKELKVFGAYGQTPSHIQRSIPYLFKYQDTLESLVEAVIKLQQVDSIMEDVLRGEAYRYIIDLRRTCRVPSRRSPATSSKVAQ